VFQIARDHRFGEELATLNFVLSRLWLEHLDGDGPVDRRLTGSVNQSHSAFAQHFEQVVVDAGTPSWFVRLTEHPRLNHEVGLGAGRIVKDLRLQRGPGRVAFVERSSPSLVDVLLDVADDFRTVDGRHGILIGDRSRLGRLRTREIDRGIGVDFVDGARTFVFGFSLRDFDRLVDIALRHGLLGRIDRPAAAVHLDRLPADGRFGNRLAGIGLRPARFDRLPFVIFARHLDRFSDVTFAGHLNRLGNVLNRLRRPLVFA